MLNILIHFLVTALFMKSKLLTWNKNVKLLFGYSGDELNNKFASEFVYIDDKEWVIEK